MFRGNKQKSLEPKLTRRCGRFWCGGRCWCGGGFGCGSNNRWKARLGVNCTESFRSQIAVWFEADHHGVATGLHRLWHRSPTECTFDGLYANVLKSNNSNTFKSRRFSINLLFFSNEVYAVRFRFIKFKIDSRTIEQPLKFLIELIFYSGDGHIWYC